MNEDSRSVSSALAASSRGVVFIGVAATSALAVGILVHAAILAATTTGGLVALYLLSIHPRLVPSAAAKGDGLSPGD